ncbi:hypothetical protein HH219_07180 [Pseudoalteromonas sp. NEC-BIFX-2020_015]|uniref:alpha/beta hydrolase family protein n=1 Tax=Pseudoalteromonas sp. NEC-BIFX-2020_015 TaxID=2729544 RepID=UPI0014615F7C|nr:hypothetical protein [Pseudoalteromonas sp. NEC-BIFX-2020_015]NMR25314.1 hypothetical protein [Pseudoalteromonas sp. NEC-BIFX-2020_015]
MFKSKVSILSVAMALGLAGCSGEKPAVVIPSVGVQSFYFSNDNITNHLSPLLIGTVPLEENDERQLLAKVWYPAVGYPDEKTRFYYGYHTEEYNLPIDPNDKESIEFFNNNKVKSLSYQNAKPLNKRYPVIVYSHGLAGNVEDNEPYFESLVEQGYVVVSVGHTYEAGFVNFAPGKYALFDEDYAEHANNTTLPEDEIDHSMLISDEDLLMLGSISAGEPIPVELLKRYFYSEGNVKTGERAHLDLWVEDINFVLSELEKINQGIIQSDLKGIFDLTTIGAAGHSYGGATARRFCNQEANCLASVHLDGDIYELYEEKIVNPHMSLSADVNGWVAAQIRNNEEFAAQYMAATQEEIAEMKAEIEIYFSAYKNAHIYSADSDIVLFSPKSISHADFHTRWINYHEDGLGKVIWHDIIESSSAAFFNSYLKDNTGVAKHPTDKLCALLLDGNIEPYYNTLCD